MPQPEKKTQKPKPKGKSPEVAPDRKARWGNPANFTFTPYSPAQPKSEIEEAAIDITGLEFEMVEAFVVSRYYGESTLIERMASTSPEAIDPFQPLSSIRAKLDALAAQLRCQTPGLTNDEVSNQLSRYIHRSD